MRLARSDSSSVPKRTTPDATESVVWFEDLLAAGHLAMPPGIYLPDATEGIIRVEDLPKPLILERSRNYLRQC
jgi:hypothetical protein